MAFCTNCGAELKGGNFCVNCGKAVNVNNDESASKVKARKISVKHMVWSVVNTVIGMRTLGILAIVFTVIATEISDDVRAHKYLKIATILNMVGLISAIVVAFLMLIYLIFAILFGGWLSLAAMSMIGMA